MKGVHDCAMAEVKLPILCPSQCQNQTNTFVILVLSSNEDGSKAWAFVRLIVPLVPAPMAEALNHQKGLGCLGTFGKRRKFRYI